MHTYIENRTDRLWTVGYWLTDDNTRQWFPLRDFTHEVNAEAFTNYLNGGDGRIFVPCE